MMEKLGDFIGRKNDGEPGTISMWRGIQRLIEGANLYQPSVKK